jgi:hypothetical protein
MAEDLLLSEGGCAALQAAAPPTCALIGRLLHFYIFYIVFNCSCLTLILYWQTSALFFRTYYYVLSDMPDAD